MGWAVGYDDNWKRDIGYGVPAYCDHPKCSEEIDRGLAFVCCDQEPYGGKGCGLYFCEKHSGLGGKCPRCRHGKPPYKAKADHPTWMRHKLRDPSWAQWRAENPEKVEEIRKALRALAATPAAVTLLLILALSGCLEAPAEPAVPVPPARDTVVADTCRPWPQCWDPRPPIFSKGNA